MYLPGILQANLLKHVGKRGPSSKGLRNADTKNTRIYDDINKDNNKKANVKREGKTDRKKDRVRHIEIDQEYQKYIWKDRQSYTVNYKKPRKQLETGRNT